MKRLSNAQVDRLGERLRSLEYGEDELRLLDEYRRTFGAPYDHVVETIQRVTGAAPGGRPAKSTSSIVEKLNRESIRLSQVQDIAGCRVVVADLAEQDRTVNAIASAFEKVTILDRREKPSHGYRAVHLVVRESAKPIEVQVRTTLQHYWAELSEKLADTIEPAIKYGGGPVEDQKTLEQFSGFVRQIEKAEVVVERRGSTDEFVRTLRGLREQFIALVQRLIKDLPDES